jgi:hypothetical protein
MPSQWVGRRRRASCAADDVDRPEVAQASLRRVRPPRRLVQHGQARYGGGTPTPRHAESPRPLALAQFICSFAGSNMNVMINDISRDLDTTVQGVQLAITIFLLVMAAPMRSWRYR